MKEKIDLLSTVEYGGCSAKMPAGILGELLKGLPGTSDPDLLVDVDTHDDAGVYRLDPSTALIFTTDFFPPVCSDPFQFGQIAAANALSDIYAMGGRPLLALNLMMFSRDKLPLEAFSEILRGGHEKVSEAGGLIIGGHTIDDHPPKYGLAVVGTVHPDKLITNAGIRPGDQLILTKPLGTGAILSGIRTGLAAEEDYRQAIRCMMELNHRASEVAIRFGSSGMTDITGFGLAGHALKMAEASGVSIRIRSSGIPLLPGAYRVFEKGSIPGATFRNLEFTGDRAHYIRNMDYHLKMLAHDAQTSGGLLMAVNPDHAGMVLKELQKNGTGTGAAIVGEVLNRSPRLLYME